MLRSEQGRKRLIPHLLLICASWCLETLPFPTFAQEAEGDGLTGQYFNGYNTFTGVPLLTRIDPQIDFNWILDAPSTTLPDDYFSIKWSGMVKAPLSEVYTFTTNSDDGVKLVVNGTVLIDKLVNQQETKWSGSIALEAGKKYSIELYYFEERSIALCQLSWSSTSTPIEIIPKAQLYHEIEIDNGGNPTALDEKSLFTPFRLYPVPTSSTLHIQLTNKSMEPVEPKIYTILGKDLTGIGRVWTEDEWIVNLDGLEAGTYVVQIGELRKAFYKK